MRRPLGLDCLTLLDADPAALIRVASEAGYAEVSLWVQPPVLPGGTLAGPDAEAGIRRALADTGVALGNLEVFNINGDKPIADYEPALAFGAGLGARSATAIDYGPARADIADRFAQFCALARRHGIEPLLEPIAMGATRTVRDGLALIDASAADARIVLDMHHFVRTGCSINDLPQEGARRIGYVQICDGPAVIPAEQADAESTEERLYPGDGDFPIPAILRAVPRDIPWAVEAPSRSRRMRGLSPLDRAREAMAATRRVIDALDRANQTETTI